MNISEPLAIDHPLVEEGVNRMRCHTCRGHFYPTQRVVLEPDEKTQTGNICKAIIHHATCRTKGIKSPMGTIDRIKDGNGSPYPVLLTNGLQATFKECELDV